MTRRLWTPPGAFADPACPLDWAYPLNRDTVGHWLRLPNHGWSGGSTLYDLVRGGRTPHDGTLTNGPTWEGPQGRPGGWGALRFNGSNFVNCNSAPLSSGVGAAQRGQIFTVSVWIRGNTDNKFIWVQGGDTNGSYSLFYNTGILAFSAEFAAASDSGKVYTLDGNWHHITCVAPSGWVANTDLKIYVDGKELTSTIAGTSIGSTGTTLLLGCRASGSAGWIGEQDDTRAYSRALSAAEVAALYDQSLRGYPEMLRWVRGISYSMPDDGGSTFTATATLVVGATTFSGAATFTPGTKTASATFTVGSVTASGSATFVAPVYTGTVAVTTGAATCSASATFAAGTKTASAAVSTGATTLAGTATFAPGTKTATAAVTTGATTCSASATFAPGTKTATAAVASGPVTCSGSATFAAPVYTGSSAVTVGAATASGSAIFSSSVSVGTITVAVSAATLSGAATFSPGTKTATAAVAVGAATLTASAQAANPIYTGSSTFTLGAATLSGSATFAELQPGGGAGQAGGMAPAIFLPPVAPAGQKIGRAVSGTFATIRCLALPAKASAREPQLPPVISGKSATLDEIALSPEAQIGHVTVGYGVLSCVAIPTVVRAATCCACTATFHRLQTLPLRDSMILRACYQTLVRHQQDIVDIDTIRAIFQEKSCTKNLPNP